VQGIASLTGRVARALVTAAYTYDRTRDNGSVSCCIAGADVFNATRAVGDPNDFSRQEGPASFNRTHTFVFSPTIDLPLGFSVSGIYRAFSGVPWTPRFSADVNGDGAVNDRLYVPTDAEVDALSLFGTAQVQTDARALLRQKIAGDECLSTRRGQFVGRNVCRNPWQNVLDARVAKRFQTVRGQAFEVAADFFNVLNGLNRDWGRRLEVSANDQALLIPRTFDPTTLKYSYGVNATYGTATPSQLTLTQQFQMQLGVRYSF
jgi:hypothetical protein